MVSRGHGEMVQMKYHDFGYIHMVQWFNGSIFCHNFIFCGMVKWCCANMVKWLS